MRIGYKNTLDASTQILLTRPSALLSSDNTEFISGVNVSFKALQRSIDISGERQLRAGFDAGPSILNFYTLRNGERVLKVYTKVSGGTVHFGMA